MNFYAAPTEEKDCPVPELGNICGVTSSNITAPPPCRNSSSRSDQPELIYPANTDSARAKGPISQVVPDDVLAYRDMVWRDWCCAVIPAKEVLNEEGKKVPRPVGTYTELASAWRNPACFPDIWESRMALLGAEPLTLVAVLLSPEVAALDIDRHPGKVSGWTSLESCTNLFGQLQTTYRQTSRSGSGQHFVGRIAAGCGLFTCRDIFPGIDFLSTYSNSNGTPSLLYFKPPSLGGHSVSRGGALLPFTDRWIAGLLTAQALKDRTRTRSKAAGSTGRDVATRPTQGAKKTQSTDTSTPLPRVLQDEACIPRMSPEDLAALKVTLRKDFNRVSLGNMYAHANSRVQSDMRASRSFCLWVLLRPMCAQAFQLRDGVIHASDFREALGDVLKMAFDHAWRAHPNPEKRNNHDFSLSEGWATIDCQLRYLRARGLVYARSVVRRDWNSLRLHCDKAERIRRVNGGRRTRLIVDLEHKVSAGLIRLGFGVSGLQRLKQGFALIGKTNNSTDTMLCRVQNKTPTKLLAACGIPRRYNKFFSLRRISAGEYKLTLWLPTKGEAPGYPVDDAIPEYVETRPPQQLWLKFKSSGEAQQAMPGEISGAPGSVLSAPMHEAATPCGEVPVAGVGTEGVAIPQPPPAQYQNALEPVAPPSESLPTPHYNPGEFTIRDGVRQNLSDHCAHGNTLREYGNTCGVDMTSGNVRDADLGALGLLAPPPKLDSAAVAKLRAFLRDAIRRARVMENASAPKLAPENDV